MNPAPPVIAFDNLTKRYRNFEAVHDLTLRDGARKVSAEGLEAALRIFELGGVEHDGALEEEEAA